MFFLNNYINKRKTIKKLLKRKKHERLDPEQAYQRAKELLFLNSGNFHEMKRQREYEEYCQYNISRETELKLIDELADDLVEQISSGADPWKVGDLAYFDAVDDEYILQKFKTISKISSVQNLERIIDVTKKEKNVIPNYRYEKIIELLENALQSRADH